MLMRSFRDRTNSRRRLPVFVVILLLLLGWSASHAQTPLPDSERPVFTNAAGKAVSALAVQSSSTDPTHPGQLHVEITLTAPPSGWHWDPTSVQVSIYQIKPRKLLDQGPAIATKDPDAFTYDWTLLDPSAIKGADDKNYEATAQATLVSDGPTPDGSTRSFVFQADAIDCEDFTQSGGKPFTFLTPAASAYFTPGLLPIKVEPGTPDNPYYVWDTDNIHISVILNSQSSSSCSSYGKTINSLGQCVLGEGNATMVQSNVYEWDWDGEWIASHLPSNNASNRDRFDINVTGLLRDYRTGQIVCGPDIERNLLSSIYAVVGGWARQGPRSKLDAYSSCQGCNNIPTGSFTDPLSGNQSFDIPITSGDFGGMSVGFGLTYNSVGLVDPATELQPIFDGLSAYNPKWSHTFAQWIDFYTNTDTIDINGNYPLYAVWHHGGSAMSFPALRDSSRTLTGFKSPDSYHTLNYQPKDGNGQALNPTTSCVVNGTSRTTIVPVPVYSFTLKDADQTVYTFNGATTGVGLAFNGGGCTDFPHYLLTQITDRWGRKLIVHWDNSFHVDTVRFGSASGPGFKFTYMSFTPPSGTAAVLLTSVTRDTGPGTSEVGTSATLGYSFYPNEYGSNQEKLTSVTVNGPAFGQQRKWTFDYSNRTHTGASGSAYGGGLVTNDLVTRKTEPDGLATDYFYATIGSVLSRSTSDQWDGRIAKVIWDDSSEPPPANPVKEIDVSPGSPATLTYPGGVSTEYTYSPIDGATVGMGASTRTPLGGDLTQVKDSSTGSIWKYAYDAYDDAATYTTGRHNPTMFFTPLELSSTGIPIKSYPLEQIDYHFSNDLLSQTTTKELLPSGGAYLQRTASDTYFNPYLLPTQSTLYSSTGNQTTQFQYDNSAAANLIQITEPDLSTVGFGYASPNAPDSPTSQTNEVGGVSTFGYESATGRPTTAASPVNTALANAGYPASYDTPPSTETVAYNASGSLEGLPSVLADPMGSSLPATDYRHKVRLSYAAVGPPNSQTTFPNLKVTATYGDNSASSVTYDPMGRVIEAADENGVLTRWTYNPAGQVKQVVEAVGGCEQQATTYSYDARGDLVDLYPPRSHTSQTGCSGIDGSTTTLDPVNKDRYKTHFDYMRYDRYNLTATPTIYEGQVTHIHYPASTVSTVVSPTDNGRDEYFGYYDPAKGVSSPNNGAGELYWWRKRDGRFVIYTYDDLHRLTTASYPADVNWPGFSIFNVTYDDLGRLTYLSEPAGNESYGYDVMNRLVSETPSYYYRKGLNYGYTKDTLNHRWITTETVSGLGTYTWREDSKGRPFDLTNPYNQEYLTLYNPDGQLLRRSFGNNEVETFGYTTDGRDRLNLVSYLSPSGGILAQFGYSYVDGNFVYDPTGHVHQEIDQSGHIHHYDYDKLYRLTSESYPILPYSSGINTLILYGYDRNDNRTSRNQDGVTEYSGVNERDELLWSNRTNAAPSIGQSNPYALFTNDENGRRSYRYKQSAVSGPLEEDLYAWDAADHLEVANSRMNGGAWAQKLAGTYDASGLRQIHNDPQGVQHNYTFGLGGLTYDNAVGGTPITYTNGLAQRQGGNDKYLHYDGLGSLRATTNVNGTSFPEQLNYDGYGRVAFQIDPLMNPIPPPSEFEYKGAWGYQSEYRISLSGQPNGPGEEGLGLDYLDQRYYDRESGRFISPDPIGFAGGLNLYAYCDDDPVNCVDPSGLDGGPLDRIKNGFSGLGRWAGRQLGRGLNWVGGLPHRAIDRLAGNAGGFDPFRNANPMYYCALHEGFRQAKHHVIDPAIDATAFAGLGSADALAEEATDDTKYLVYSIRNEEDQVIYVGKATGNGSYEQVLSRRFSNHDYDDLGSVVIEDINESYDSNRGAEDVIFNRERLRAEQEGRRLLNKRSPVGPRNPNRRRYIDAYYQEMRK